MDLLVSKVAGDWFSNYACLELFRWPGESGKIIGQGVKARRGSAVAVGTRMTSALRGNDRRASTRRVSVGGFGLAFQNSEAYSFS